MEATLERGKERWVLATTVGVDQEGIYVVGGDALDPPWKKHDRVCFDISLTGTDGVARGEGVLAVSVSVGARGTVALRLRRS